MKVPEKDRVGEELLAVSPLSESCLPIFIPSSSCGALQFLEDEQLGGNQMKLKASSLRSKKRIYLVDFSSLKYTDLSVVEGDIRAGVTFTVQGV